MLLLPPLLCGWVVSQSHMLGETSARPPWAEVAENAALEPPSQRVALRSPGWLLCMCSIVVAFHGRASKVCGVVGEAATSRCLGGPEAPLEASPDDACAREPRPGSAETGAAAAPGSASAIIKESTRRSAHLKPLEAYEKELAKRMAGEKKRLREAMEADAE